MRKVTKVSALSPLKNQMVQGIIPAPSTIPSENTNIHPTTIFLTSVEDIEKKFLESTGLNVDLSKYPLENDPNQQVITDKNKSDEHGEVFTPLWLVDDMLDRVDNKSWRDQSLTTEDLCAGYGQFTVRMLRKKYSLLKNKFDLNRFLTETHLFIELQPNSCFHLLYTFGKDIRLLIGDASQKSKLPDEVENGIWVWSDTCGKWYDRTTKVKALFDRYNLEGKSVKENAAKFEKEFKSLLAMFEDRKKNHGK